MAFGLRNLLRAKRAEDKRKGEEEEEEERSGGGRSAGTAGMISFENEELDW